MLRPSRNWLAGLTGAVLIAGAWMGPSIGRSPARPPGPEPAVRPQHPGLACYACHGPGELHPRPPEPDALVVPPAPGHTLARELEGREIYARAGCAGCHGGLGRGDGPAASGLETDRGVPIRPRDFTFSQKLACGGRVEDIYRTLLTGIDGTPMHAVPGLGPDERWALAYFLMSLSRQPAPDLQPAPGRQPPTL